MNRQLFQYHPIVGHQFIPGLRTREEHEGGGYLLRGHAFQFGNTAMVLQPMPWGVWLASAGSFGLAMPQPIRTPSRIPPQDSGRGSP